MDHWTKVRTRETHGIQQELWDLIVTTPSLFIIRLLRKGGSPSLLILRSTLIRTLGPHIWKHKIQILKHLFFPMVKIWARIWNSSSVAQSFDNSHHHLNIKVPNIFFYLFPPYTYVIYHSYTLMNYSNCTICGHLNASSPLPDPWSDHHIHTLWRHYPCTLDTPIMRISSACLW